MATVIAVLGRKGGITKTTLAANLAAALYEVGLLDRCEKDENGGYGYVVRGG